MVGAVPTAVRFYCPECGTGLRALCVDAGSVLDCHRCGVRVRVPRKPHPVESETESSVLSLGDDGREAREGTKQLLFSLSIQAQEFLIAVGICCVWIASEGIERFLERDPGGIRWLLCLLAAVAFGLFNFRSLIRYLAYVAWQPAAEVFASKVWLKSAKIGVVLRTLGVWMVLMPFFLGYTASETPIVLRAAAEIGVLAWAVGRVFEFGVVFAWYRVLLELAGQTAARLAARFVATSIGALLGMAVAVSLAGIAIILSLRGGEQNAPLDFANLPPTANIAIFAVLGLFAISCGTLFVQYCRVLVRLRKALTAAAIAESI